MIERLKECIFEYYDEISNMSSEEIQQKENLSFTVSGTRLEEMPSLLNEKIKISDTFTHYIIERCSPNHVNILRRFVEDYEQQVEMAKDDMFSQEALEQLKQATVAINLLFGMDVSYYTKLHQMFLEGKEENLVEYFSENIDRELSYYDLCITLNKGGFHR